MNIKKYIKECYELAKEKGFYPDDSKIEDHLMGIVSELGEAYEAHRGGNIASEKGLAFSIDQILENFNLPIHIDYYIKYFKDSSEDEIADVFIRLFNLCGWLGIENVELKNIESMKRKDISMLLLSITHLCSDMAFSENKQDIRYITMPLEMLIFYCKDNNIPIEKHIQAKHEFNKTREHLHGKQY